MSIGRLWRKYRKLLAIFSMMILLAIATFFFLTRDPQLRKAKLAYTDYGKVLGNEMPVEKFCLKHYLTTQIDSCGRSLENLKNETISGTATKVEFRDIKFTFKSSNSSTNLKTYTVRYQLYIKNQNGIYVDQNGHDVIASITVYTDASSKKVYVQSII